MPATEAGFTRSARVIAFHTLVSRLLGLGREALLGYVFGASGLLSAFRIAWMVPNLSRRIFGEGALSAAAVPILTTTLRSEGDEQARRFVGAMISGLVLVLSGLVVGVELGVLLLWQLRPDPVWTLLLLLLPYTVLVCVVAVGGGVLNVRGHFSIPAAAPSILNLGMIAALAAGALVWALPPEQIMLLVCGAILVSGVVQVAITGWMLARVGLWPIFTWPWKDPHVRKVLALMAPMILGLSAVQVNTLSDYLIAWFFVRRDGEPIGPALLGFAQYLFQLPLGIFGIAIATAIFPLLAEKAASADRPAVARITRRGLRLGFFVSLPAAVGLILVARPLVTALYERGNFDPADTPRVAAVLICYTLGLPAYFAQHVIVRALYSVQDSRTPARTAATMVAANVLLNLILVFPLQERGLALASAVCAWVQVIWLGACLRRRLHAAKPSAWAADVSRVVFSALAMAAVVVGVLWLAAGQYWGRWQSLVQLALAVPAGVAVFAGVAAALGCEELGWLLRRSPLQRGDEPSVGSVAHPVGESV